MTSPQQKPLPPGWKRVKLGEVCEVIGGSTPDTKEPSYWSGEIPWATPTDLGKLAGNTIAATDRQITRAGLESCSTRMLPVGAVVMSTRAPIGHLGVAGIELCTNQGCKSFVPGSDLDSFFLYWALKKSVPAIQALGSGATFTEVSKSSLLRFEIPLPPLAEQQRIVVRLERQMALVEQARAAAEEIYQNISSLKAAFLREIFS